MLLECSESRCWSGIHTRHLPHVVLLNSHNNSMRQVLFESRLMDEESELREVQKRAQGSRSWKWLRQGVSPGSLVPHLGSQLPMSVRTRMRRTILTT